MTIKESKNKLSGNSINQVALAFFVQTTISIPLKLLLAFTAKTISQKSPEIAVLLSCGCIQNTIS